MIISASISNVSGSHQVTVQTNDSSKELNIPSGRDGQGSGVNGGEFLCLAIATCFCNDLFREAKKRNLKIESVQVEASATFGGEGEPATSIQYKPVVQGHCSPEEIAALIAHTDTVTEIQNTLRRGTQVLLVR